MSESQRVGALVPRDDTHELKYILASGVDQLIACQTLRYQSGGGRGHSGAIAPVGTANMRDVVI
jgi:hypothetical protein